MSEQSGHWDSELFRREGHRMVEWIAEYLDGGNRKHPVLSPVQPGEVAAKLPDEMPVAAEDPEAVWQDFLDIVLPGVTHWNHPGFMAYFSITGSGPGVLGEMLSAALDVNGMLWRTCPSATELELKVLDWMRRGLGLPDDFFGFLNDTASISSLLALAAAREAADPEIRHHGMAGAAMRVYASDQAHSSIAKACLTLGFGLDGYRAVPHDAEYRMDTDALARMVGEDRAAGFRPMAVVATVGTTARIDTAGQHTLCLRIDPSDAVEELYEDDGEHFGLRPLALMLADAADAPAAGAVVVVSVYDSDPTDLNGSTNIRNFVGTTNDAGTTMYNLWVNSGKSPPEVMATAEWEPFGDLDEDGDVDLSDLAILLSRYGLECP